MRNLEIYILVLGIIIVQVLEVQSITCKFNDNRIECLNSDIDEAINEINEITQELNLDVINHLTLTGIAFKNNQIERGWLSNITLQFSSLTISDTNLSKLEDRAFSGKPFELLTILHLGNTEIEVITSGCFQDTKLTILGITYDSDHSLIIEKNALGVISQSLIVLSFRGCLTSDTLLNVTGPNTELVSLISLTLSDNYFPKLLKDSFIGVTSLKVLYLDGSKISEIEQGTFDPPMLERLNLGNNELSTLPGNLFQYVKGGISIYSNKWHCDCNLVWLRDLFYYYPYLFTHREFYCTTPEGNIPYQQINFCPTTLFM